MKSLWGINFFTAMDMTKITICGMLMSMWRQKSGEKSNPAVWMISLVTMGIICIIKERMKKRGI